MTAETKLSYSTVTYESDHIVGLVKRGEATVAKAGRIVLDPGVYLIYWEHVNHKPTEVGLARAIMMHLFKDSPDETMVAIAIDEDTELATKAKAGSGDAAHTQSYVDIGFHVPTEAEEKQCVVATVIATLGDLRAKYVPVAEHLAVLG